MLQYRNGHTDLLRYLCVPPSSETVPPLTLSCSHFLLHDVDHHPLQRSLGTRLPNHHTSHGLPRNLLRHHHPPGMDIYEYELRSNVPSHSGKRIIHNLGSHSSTSVGLQVAILAYVIILFRIIPLSPSSSQRP